MHKGLAGLELDQVSDKVSFQNVHYRAAAATAYGTLVKGGYEYAGQSYAGEYKHVEGFQACTECHDAHTTQIKADTCAVCHRSAKGGALDRIRMAKVDYDGNGNGQTNADEVGRANVYKSWTPRLAMAAYNYQFIAKDPGGFAHNGKYMVQLLQDSIQDLGGDIGQMTRP